MPSTAESIRRLLQEMEQTVINARAERDVALKDLANVRGDLERAKMNSENWVTVTDVNGATYKCRAEVTLDGFMILGAKFS